MKKITLHRFKREDMQ